MPFLAIKYARIQAHALHVSLRDTDVAAQARIHRLRMTLKVAYAASAVPYYPKKPQKIRA